MTYFDSVTVDKDRDFSGTSSYAVTLKRGVFRRTISELELDDLIVLRDVLNHYINQETA